MKYTVTDGTLPTYIEVNNAGGAAMKFKYKVLDQNQQCSVERLTDSWGAVGVVKDGNTVVGTWSLQITPDSFLLTISYNENISIIKDGDILKFYPSSAFPLYDTHCAAYFFQVGRYSSTTITSNTYLDKFYIKAALPSYCAPYVRLLQMPRVENETTFKIRYQTLPTKTNYTVSLSESGAFTVALSAEKGNTIGVKIISANNKLLSDMELGTSPKQFFTYTPVDRLVFYFVSSGTPAGIDDLNEVCFVNWLKDNTVNVTFNFYDSETLEELSGVNFTISGDYEYDGLADTGQVFTMIRDSIFQYSAYKDGYVVKSGEDIADMDKAVNILMDRAEGGEVSFGNPHSKYVIILDKYTAKINEQITVKVKNTAPGWFEGEWVEGAEIYVDGVPTGKKTVKTVNWFLIGWLFNNPFLGWIVPEIPKTVIQISEPGDHYVYAKVGNEYSQAAVVTITAAQYDVDGGSDSGTYPSTQPDEDNCQYKLIYHPQTLKVGGSVTFKTVKVCGGQISGSVDSLIYIDGSYVGEARPELVYKFQEAGVHRVKANVNGKWTGEGTVYVYDSTNDFIRDSGGINLTVRVYAADNKQPLAGILVHRLAGSAVVEQRKTDINGIAVLHPEPGMTYGVHVADPSNRYLSQYREGLSWMSDDTLTFYLKPAGDVDEDNRTESDVADELTLVEVRVDGFAEDGLSLPPGKHRITVVDQKGRELTDAKIYINGEMVGKTSGFGCFVWGCLLGAGLDYEFELGHYEVRGEYEALTDMVYVNITNAVQSYMLVAYSEGSDSAVMNHLTVPVNKIVRFEVCEVDSGKPVHEWKRVDNAIIIINGNETGITKPIGGFLGFWRVTAYEHRFSKPGNYTVFARFGDAETQTMTVTVTQSEEEATAGGLLGEFFGQIAEALPLTGIGMLDTILWAVIIVIGGLLFLSVVVRVVL